MTAGELVVGLGCKAGVSADAVLAAVDAALLAHERTRGMVRNLATVPLKSDETGLQEAAQRLGVELVIADLHTLAKMDRRTPTQSPASREATGFGSACEAAALAGAGERGRLLGERVVLGPVACALALIEGARA